MTSSTTPVPDSSTSARRMQVGIAGLGAGAVQVIWAMAHAPYTQLMAALEVVLAIRPLAHEHWEILLSHQCDAY
jgi:hypothetical protein